MVMTILMGCSLLIALFGGRLGVSDWLRGAMRYVIIPPGDGAMYLVTEFKERRLPTGSALTAEQAKRLQAQNQALRRQVYALAAERYKWWHRATIINRMRSRFGATPAFPYDLIATRVVAGEALPYGTGRVLGAGRGRGVVVGAPVTTCGLRTDRAKALPKGSAAVVPPPQNLLTVASGTLVGRISQAGEFAAALQLVTDPHFRINARIRRELNPRNPRMIIPRTGGSPVRLTPYNNKLIDVVAVGDGKESIIVANVAKDHTVRVGDRLVSRTDEYFLPVEISIGRIVAVRPDLENPGFAKLRVQPDASLLDLREVYVVVPRGGPGEATGGGR